MTFSTSIGTTGVTKKLLHFEVVKNSTKDLFPCCIVLARVGPIEEKFLLSRQRGQVVRVPDLKAGILSSSPAMNTSGIFPCRPWLNPSAALVYSQLVCLLPVGILNLLSLFQSGVPVN